MDNELIEKVATELHEQWRADYRNLNGDAPRIKETGDTDWISANGTDRVDIAAAEFAELPADWQAENRQAAQTLVSYLEEHADADELRGDPAARAAAGAHIHTAWLGRNPWARGGELDAPFDRLPNSERAKDLAQLDLALRMLAA